MDQQINSTHHHTEIKKMHFLKITLALVISLLLLTSCSRSHEFYDFESRENVFSWGVVGADLIGKEKLLHNTVVRSSPYNLLIWFGSDTVIEGTIHISGLKLVNTKTKMVVFKYDKIIEKPIQKDVNSYTVYFSFKSLKLEYEEMVLQMKFLLKQSGKTAKYKAEIFFEKDYKKFRRIISH